MINVTLSNNNGFLVVMRISLITHNVLVCPISLVGGSTLAGNDQLIAGGHLKIAPIPRASRGDKVN